MSTGAAEWQQPGRWRRSAPRLIAFGFLLALLGPGGALALQPADCGGPTTATLAEVRGLDQPPLPEGESVVIEAVVTASFPGREGLNGFFIESQSTLEPAGAFVYAPQLTADRAPARGERWRLRARAGRFRGRIQLEALDAAVQCGFGRIEPPVLSASDLEAPGHFVDRLVHIPGPLTVTGVYNLGRYGSLRLSAGGRAFQPNNGTPGGRLLPLILDDGSHQRDPRPVPYLDPDGVRRAGDRVEAITGIITRAFGDWRIHPVTPPTFQSTNPRPDPPPPHDGVRVVHFNVENYFLDRQGRGPSTEAGFRRQRQRIRATLDALDGDVLVLHELENRPAVVADFLDLVNESEPPRRHYQAVLTPRSPAVIRTVILYRPDRMELIRAGRQVAAIHPRDPVVALFRHESGQQLAVAGAHFKSRTRCPDAGDIDRGEGCWAERRRGQSEALVEWLGEWLSPEAMEAVPLLVTGDLNAYAREAPARVLEDVGLANQLARHVPPAQRYNYVFRGRAGYLNHVFANAAAAEKIQRLRIWSVNADEPVYLIEEGDDVWRASDHDPLVVDMKTPHSG